MDISTPSGSRFIRKPEGRKTYTLNEAYEKCCDILSSHYGCDVRKW
jgi:hypothetical protein